jgi:hypothetical protein
MRVTTANCGFSIDISFRKFAKKKHQKWLLCLTGLPFYLNGNTINMKPPACALLKIEDKLSMLSPLNHQTLFRNLGISRTTYLLSLMAGFIVGEAVTKVAFISELILYAGLKNICRRNRNGFNTNEHEQDQPCLN